MDSRFMQPQRLNGEAAVPFRDQTLSRWSTCNLDKAARWDAEEAHVTKLSSQTFESFCKMLDEPMPKAAYDLLVHKEIWA